MLADELQKYIGNFVFINCRDGSKYTTSGILTKIIGDYLAVVDYKDICEKHSIFNEEKTVQITKTKSFVLIKDITRFSVDLSKNFEAFK